MMTYFADADNSFKHAVSRDYPITKPAKRTKIEGYGDTS
jgi:hypothetical protein